MNSISVSDPDQFRFGHETDPGSKKSAKSWKNHKNIINFLLQNIKLTFNGLKYLPHNFNIKTNNLCRNIF